MSGIPGYVVPKPGPRQEVYSIPKAKNFVGSMYYQRKNPDPGFAGLAPEDWGKEKFSDKKIMGKAKRSEFKGNNVPAPGAYNVHEADFVTHPRVLAPKQSKAQKTSYMDNVVRTANRYYNADTPKKIKTEPIKYAITEPRTTGLKWVAPKKLAPVKPPKDKFPKPNTKFVKGQQEFNYRPTEERPAKYSFPKEKDTNFIVKIVKNVEKDEKARYEAQLGAGVSTKDSPLMTLPANMARGTKFSQTYFGYKGRQTAHGTF